MNKFLQAFQQKNKARTENNAITNYSSRNPILDLFFLAGASRQMSESDIVKIFALAYEYDKVAAIKVLFWARNCRGGAGERRFFRICLRYLSENDFNMHDSILEFIPEVGRWDDLFDSGMEYVVNEYRSYISNPQNDIALLAKWTPRKGRVFNIIRKELNLTPKQLRKILVLNTKVVETQMCDNEWDSIEYEKVPSLAFKRYSRAFKRHSELRFERYIKDVLLGNKKINASVLFPHDVYNNFKKDVDGTDRKSIIAMWDALPNYMEDSQKYRILPVCDVSGSMMGLPMDVSISLGCYLSERNEGVFKDAFITFSAEPKMNYLKGSIVDRFSQLSKADWGMNTDLSKVFAEILNTAIDNKLKSEDLPNFVLIISDMEFDQGILFFKSTFDRIKTRYKLLGYEMPKIIFWNVRGRIGNVPVLESDLDVALVSGFSPSIMSSVLSAKQITPLDVMNETLDTDISNRIENKLNNLV